VAEILLCWQFRDEYLYHFHCFQVFVFSVLLFGLENNWSQRFSEAEKIRTFLKALWEMISIPRIRKLLKDDASSADMSLNPPSCRTTWTGFSLWKMWVSHRETKANPPSLPSDCWEQKVSDWASVAHISEWIALCSDYHWVTVVFFCSFLEMLCGKDANEVLSVKNTWKQRSYLCVKHREDFKYLFLSLHKL